jgi:hypothetical protein
MLLKVAERKCFDRACFTGPVVKKWSCKGDDEASMLGRGT